MEWQETNYEVLDSICKNAPEDELAAADGDVNAVRAIILQKGTLPIITDVTELICKVVVETPYNYYFELAADNEENMRFFDIQLTKGDGMPALNIGDIIKTTPVHIVQPPDDDPILFLNSDIVRM